LYHLRVILNPSFGRVRQNLATIITYSVGLAVAFFISVSVSYRYLVYLSIAEGLAICMLLLLGVYLTGNINKYSSLFVVGILLMMVALLNSDAPTKAVLGSLRHISLVLSMILSGVYTSLALFRRIERQLTESITSRIDRNRLKPYSDFATAFCTTLSSELCSCLHPIIILDMIGISILVPSQVQVGFLLITMTLIHQLMLVSRLSRSRIARIIPL
jgi:hypothetical protein